MMKYYFICIALVFAVRASAQLSVSVDSPIDTLYGGGPMVVSYKINVPAGTDLTSLDFSAFEKVENLLYPQDTVNLDKYMEIDIFDGGGWNINNGNLTVTKSNGQPITVSDSIVINVSSLGAFYVPTPILGHLSNAQVVPLQRKLIIVPPSKGGQTELNALKPYIPEDTNWTDYLKYVYLLLAIVALAGAAFLAKKYLFNGAEVEEIEDAVVVRDPAHIIALQELTQLKAQGLWQSDREKEYHTELTRIMRQYVEDRYELQALEMTTSQLKASMKASEIDEDIIFRFTEILQIADKVKFAKGKTGPEINERFMEDAFDIVDKTKNKPQDIGDTND